MRSAELMGRSLNRDRRAWQSFDAEMHLAHMKFVAGHGVSVFDVEPIQH